MTRSTWIPIQQTAPRRARHLAEPSAQKLPTTATTTIATTVAAVVLGVTLAGTNTAPIDIPAQAAGLPRPDRAHSSHEAKARTIQNTVITSASRDGMLTRTVATVKAAPVVKPATAHKEVVRHQAPATHKATVAHKAPVHHTEKAHASAPKHHAERHVGKSHTIRTNAYFGQFTRAGAAERKHNAALIIEIGKKRGLSNRSIAVAVATSIQESGLRNLDWGDRDSLGLFQQRPSVRAWGTAKQIVDPVHAINQFYDRLVHVANRDHRAMIDVAMQIQIPDHHAYHSTWQWDAVATRIVNSYSA